MVNAYKVNISSISEPWFEQLMRETLDMYLRGEDLSECPVTREGRKLAKVGLWHRDCNRIWREERQNFEECFRDREKAIVDLYHSLKKDGYNGSVIVVWFDEEGRIRLHDGYHRTSIMKYLGIDGELNVQAGWGDNNWDFPLVETILKLDRRGRQTYLPVHDNRLRGFPIDRKDSYARLNYILKNLVGKTVLDIGCSEGFFSLELAKRGYEVTAIDFDPGKIAVARYLSTINNIPVNCYPGDWEELLKDGLHFDNVLYLSVFHNTVARQGAEKAFSGLSKLRDRANKLFFEIPRTDERYWIDHHREAPIYGFIGDKFRKNVELGTGMRIEDEWVNYRPMMLLGGDGRVNKGRVFQGISLNEWEEHINWESTWWGNCINTFDEQVKQEMYAGYMRLDQFADAKKSFDLRGLTVLDIGGGPVSLLLRCYNSPRKVVVDPSRWPDWVLERYKLAGIEYVMRRAEVAKFNEKFDEAWLYNVLQHVQNPIKVINMAKRSARKIRVFEALEIGVHKGHPHNLTKEALDKAFEREGLSEDISGTVGGLIYYGVFRYE